MRTTPDFYAPAISRGKSFATQKFKIFRVAVVEFRVSQFCRTRIPMTFCKRLSLYLLLAIATLSNAQTKSISQPTSVAGRWDAVITNASNLDVPFVLSIKQDRSAAGGLHASVENGTDVFPFTSAVWNAGELKLRFEQYDGEILARLEGQELKGQWTRQTSQGIRHYAF